MKPEIIPAILTKNKQDFLKRLKLAAALAPTVQIDVMDGLFVDNKTPRGLNDGAWFGEFLLGGPDRVPDIELHLMVMDPWPIIREWQEYAELKRAIWHVEVPIEHGALIERLHDLGLEAGLAIDPETPPQTLKPFIRPKTIRESKRNLRKSKFDIPNSGFVDEALVMGVHPGFSGQAFVPSALKTIKNLRHGHPKLDIGVDGHVGPETINRLILAGANRFDVSGSIFLASDPALTYQNLMRHMK